jgi:hypothetical protein
MQFDDQSLRTTGSESRSTDPLVYELEEVEVACASGVPYERAIQIARTRLALSRGEATETIERRIGDGVLRKVGADRLETA